MPTAPLSAAPAGIGHCRGVPTAECLLRSAHRRVPAVVCLPRYACRGNEDKAFCLEVKKWIEGYYKYGSDEDSDCEEGELSFNDKCERTLALWAQYEPSSEDDEPLGA